MDCSTPDHETTHASWVPSFDTTICPTRDPAIRSDFSSLSPVFARTVSVGCASQRSHDGSQRTDHSIARSPLLERCPRRATSLSRTAPGLLRSPRTRHAICDCGERSKSRSDATVDHIECSSLSVSLGRFTINVAKEKSATLAPSSETAGIRSANAIPVTNTPSAVPTAKSLCDFGLPDAL